MYRWRRWIVAAGGAALGLSCLGWTGSVMQPLPAVQRSATGLTMQQISQQILVYKARHRTVPPDLDAAYPDGPVPKDEWGHAFRYVTPGLDGRDFELISYGADGQPGGTCDARDRRLSDEGVDRRSWWSKTYCRMFDD